MMSASTAPITAKAGNSEIRLGSALFNADHGRLADELARVEASGLDFVHLDVFDGYFVSDIGFSPRTIETMRKLTDMPFEVHLGVREPMRFARPLIDAGVDLVIFHVESAPLAYETAFSIRSLGVKAGVVLSLGTPLEVVAPLLGAVDAVLLLSRVAGEGSKGASFDSAALSRISKLKEMAEAVGAGCDLQAAGGLNRSNVASVVGAGARSLSLGAGVYKVPDMAAEVAELRALAETALEGKPEGEH